MPHDGLAVDENVVAGAAEGGVVVGGAGGTGAGGVPGTGVPGPFDVRPEP